MKTLTLYRLTYSFALTLSMMIFNTVIHAEYLGPNSSTVEPSRWTQEDITPEQKLRTATTEAVNAQQQFIDDCKLLAAPRTADCVASARLNYEKEMADIRRRF